MSKKQEQPKKRPVKRQPQYDDSPPSPQWKIDEERDDLARLAKAYLTRRYKAIYKSLEGDRTMTLNKADALAILQLLTENNANFIALLEHKLDVHFLS
jgi:hypothetical protein